MYIHTENGDNILDPLADEGHRSHKPSQMSPPVNSVSPVRQHAGGSEQEREEEEDYTYLASWTKSKTQQSNSEQPPDVTYLASWRQSTDGSYRW
jgi:hypothetical protein